MGKRKTLGDEIDKLKGDILEREAQAKILGETIKDRDRYIAKLEAEIKLAAARERLRVIQEISGKEGE